MNNPNRFEHGTKGYRTSRLKRRARNPTTPKYQLYLEYKRIDFEKIRPNFVDFNGILNGFVYARFKFTSLAVLGNRAVTMNAK